MIRVVWIDPDRVVHHQGESCFRCIEYGTFFVSFFPDDSFVVKDIEIIGEEIVDATGTAACVSHEKQDGIVSGIVGCGIKHGSCGFGRYSFAGLFRKSWLFQVFGGVDVYDPAFSQIVEKSFYCPDISVDRVNTDLTFTAVCF